MGTLLLVTLTLVFVTKTAGSGVSPIESGIKREDFREQLEFGICDLAICDCSLDLVIRACSFVAK